MKKAITTTTMIILLAFSISWIHIIGVVAQESPAEVWVDDDADSEWYDTNHVLTIQEALDLVRSDGTVVRVHPGIYYENIVWPNRQGIKLVSLDGPESTIIDGGKKGTVMILDGPLGTTTVIDGFTIQNGFGGIDIPPHGRHGGGILCTNSSSPTIQNNIITRNEVDWAGGAISGFNYGFPGVCSPIIRNNIITYNKACAGAGIEFCGNSSPLIERNSIMHNWASVSSGGIECWWNVSAVIRFNLIANNSATGTYPFGNGGGILCAGGSNVVIYGNTITGNLANYAGGAICCHHRGFARIERNIISYNTANAFAVIKCAEDSSVEVIDCIISHNCGDGVHCYRSSWARIAYCTISANEGSGVYCRNSSSAVIYCNNITDNIGYGVHNIDPTMTVDARLNWWGDRSGPSGLGLGAGDEVSDYVDYSPWLRKPAGLPAQARQPYPPGRDR